MNIAYITSQYPSLTETFVARAIERIALSGHKVTICILKPFIPKNSRKAIRLKDVFEVRFTYNIILIVFCLFRIMVTKPKRLSICFKEAIISCLRNPSRAHHIFYLLMSAVWFSCQSKVKTIEYIHCHFLHTEAIATRWLSILLNVPYGINAHIVRVRFDNKQIGKIVRNASVCIGDTKETLSLLNRLGGKNITFIRNSIDVENIKNISPDKRWRNSNNPLILAAGSLLHLKGFHVLISSCAMLEKMGFDFTCRIIGEGEERENLQKMIVDNNLAEKVTLSGSASISELFEEYKRATLFVMPSVPSSVGTDGLPTVIIEAIATGLPVIGTNHAAIPDMVINEETGLIVNPDDPKALAEAIKRLSSDKNLYFKCSVNGRDKVEEESNIRINSARLQKLMQATIN